MLSKVCQYFTYKVRYTNSSTEIPEFPIPREIALELLMAATFSYLWPPTSWTAERGRGRERETHTQRETETQIEQYTLYSQFNMILLLIA